METFQKKQLINYLSTFVTQNKNEKMAEVLASRTRHITILMEDIYQAHNANAVVRSAECFGIQDLHIVEDRFAFKPSSGVAMGATKWMTFHKYKTIEDSFKALRAGGYRIIATTPHAKAQSLYDVPLDKKCALVFGTENVGLTAYALEHADEYVTIPMFGFTQSFNVSVSVALCLQQMMYSLRNSSTAWQLSEQEREDILLSWLRKIVRGSALLEKKFLSE